MGMLSYQHVQPIRAASKSRNGIVHPMLPFLLASTLTCSESQQLVENLKTNPRHRSEMKVELIEVIKTSTQKGCWDAND